MSRNVSDSLKAVLGVEETDEVFIALVTIDHQDISEPVRATSDGQATPSRGNIFNPLPFEIKLPEQSEQGLPRARLRISNVDKEIVRAVRSISTPPEVLIEVVTASAPDDVEAAWPKFEFLRVPYDATFVEGELARPDLWSEVYPYLRMGPANFPAMFR